MIITRPRASGAVYRILSYLLKIDNSVIVMDTSDPGGAHSCLKQAVISYHHVASLVQT